MRQQYNNSWWGSYWRKDLQRDYMVSVSANGAKVNELGFGISPVMWIEVQGVRAAAEGENNNGSAGSGSFKNKFGTADTKCAHSGCDSYIAASGDTNCCTAHSARCLNCNCFIDEDAMYCMSCITDSASKPSTSSGSCKFKYSDGSVCGAKCTDYPSMCNKHMKQLQDTYNSLTS